ncbi:hypothetical protein [Lactiplantibacillus plantarum]|uniref:hypothetical protein n=1 Tax=Lactiplantibacillus plantarum TaxID=1590 RepID=UPI000A201C91|nr:hypothetical protein [Lactiplantibacillus plantarum]ARO01168.1 hypothetical protein BIZ31_10035 [Lactiplantibacillus plantarum]ARO04074.1 hypothetical protein BIZ32_09845 [Lactiplantibacillus plantarum]
MTEKIQHISDIKSKDRYWDFLTSTKIYVELFWSKEAAISLIVSILFTGMFIASNFPTHNIQFTDEAKEMLNIIISCEVGILGFLIGGLALIVGSIGLKVIKKIDNLGGFTSLLGILFRFYFEGSLLALEIVISMFAYLLVGFGQPINWVLSTSISVIVGYLFVYTLISGTMLMGTCIRLMVMNYELSENTETTDYSTNKPKQE